MPRDRFPYLNATTLSEQEKERLKVRLDRESGKQRNRFAKLVDKTRESLEHKKVKCSDLSVLVQHSTKNQLFDVIENSRSIKKTISSTK